MSRVAIFPAGVADWRFSVPLKHVSKSTAVRMAADRYKWVGHRSIQEITPAELQARRAAEHLYQLRCTAKLPPVELPGLRFVLERPAEQRGA